MVINYTGKGTRIFTKKGLSVMKGAIIKLASSRVEFMKKEVAAGCGLQFRSTSAKARNIVFAVPYRLHVT